MLEELKMHERALELVRKEDLNLISSKLRIDEFLRIEYNKTDEEIRNYLSKLK